MSNIQLINWLHDGYTRLQIEEWCEVPDLVEIEITSVKGCWVKTKEDETMTLPALTKEDFYELVRNVEMVMGWKND